MRPLVVVAYVLLGLLALMVYWVLFHVTPILRAVAAKLVEPKVIFRQSCAACGMTIYEEDPIEVRTTVHLIANGSTGDVLRVAMHICQNCAQLGGIREDDPADV